MSAGPQLLADAAPHAGRATTDAETASYVPPLPLVLQGLRITPADLKGPTVAVPTAFLRFLITELVRSAPFDEAWYTTTYLDIANRHSAGQIASLHEHYITEGYFDGRLPRQPEFDPDWYYTHNRDLLHFYEPSQIGRLYSHFMSSGMNEGRVATAELWPEAERWIEAARRFGPATRLQTPSAQPEFWPSDADPAPPGPVGRATFEQTLLANFESLGWNCEFGLLQKYFNFEPLSLFAFAETPLDKLIEALERKFAGFGDPDHTSVRIEENEFCIVDAKYGFEKHTWMYHGQISEEDLLRRECKRISVLKSWLMRQMETAQKIFVYKPDGSPGDGALRDLSAAMRRYGNSVLLWVEEAADDRAGTVEILADGLFRGYIDKFSPREAADTGISYRVWIDICAEACRLWRP